METTTSAEFGKTVSTGSNAIAGGGQAFYILEHLAGSHYHQAGEQQEIMLDEIILGREADCHVRFDENFSTVSRHHASIVRDGDNWRLVQLSKKNTTFLNGKAIQDSWFLQSGDEIQLAINGPKLIFKIPTETTEYNVSQRLNSFKDQVIKPYKTAIIVVSCVILVLITAGIIAGVVISGQKKILDEQREQITLLCDQLTETNEQLMQTALRADSAQQAAIKAKSIAFKERTERIKSQQNLQEVQNQMQQLRDEMNSFYNGIINGENNN